MCEKTGVLLANLLTYLYDFNLIKTFFSFLKSYIRRYNQLANIYRPKHDRY